MTADPKVQAVVDAAREFVQIGNAFPHAPMGPKTKARFVASFRAALAALDAVAPGESEES